jgi:hypothetical protein
MEHSLQLERTMPKMPTMPAVRLAAVLLGLLMGAVPASAKIVRCTSGAFDLTDPLGVATGTTLTLAGRTLQWDLCGSSGHAQITATRTVTRITATFPPCAALLLTKKLRLKVTIPSPACNVAQIHLTSKKLKPPMNFTATLVPGSVTTTVPVGPGQTTTTLPGAPSFSQAIAPMLVAKCATSTGCHAGPNSTGYGLDMSSATAAYAGLVNKPSVGIQGATRVKPGNPAGSLMIQVLQGAVPPVQRMPLTGAPLTTAQIKLISDWIAAGAPNN